MDWDSHDPTMYGCKKSHYTQKDKNTDVAAVHRAEKLMVMTFSFHGQHEFLHENLVQVIFLQQLEVHIIGENHKIAMHIMKSLNFYLMRIASSL